MPASTSDVLRAQNAARDFRRVTAVVAIGFTALALASSSAGAVPSHAKPTSPAKATAAAPLPRLVLDASSVDQDRSEVQEGVVAPASAEWTFDTPVLEATPPPAPESTLVVRPERASRSSERSGGARLEGVSAPSSSGASSSIIDIAGQFVGVPYVSGGTSPDGFDCSGFTQYVYAQAGVSLPRSSGDQRYAGAVVPRDQAQPGDLIWSPGHVAIYAGDDTQIDSPKPGKTIQFRGIWQSDPVFIRVG